MKKDELLKGVVQKYDEYLMLKEKRNISCSELAYIQSLGTRELKELYRAIVKQIIMEKRRLKLYDASSILWL